MSVFGLKIVWCGVCVCVWIEQCLCVMELKVCVCVRGKD